MRRGALWGAAVLLVVATLAPRGSARGQQPQPLADLAGFEGWASFEVATRDDVVVCDRGISRGGSWWRGRGGRDENCVEGSLEVLVQLSDGAVVEVEHRPPGSERGPDADEDMGRVRTQDAAAYLLDVVSEGREDVAEDALGLAVLIDSVTIWPDLERFATDRSMNDDVRESALFWLGQEAAEEATRTITRVLDTPDETVEIKEAAVFALSQRPDSVAIPLLMEVARDAPHPEVKESAFFWLSQFDDPRVIRFFREVLTGA